MTALTHYLACEAKAGFGLAPGIALGAALMRAHVALCGRFALSFPDASTAMPGGVGPAASPSLGERLILFGAEADLAGVLSHLQDIEAIVFASRVRPVRNVAAHERHIRRREAVRTPATVARELRRAERRAASRGMEITEAERDRREASRRGSLLPYVHVVSLSTHRRFAIRFERLPADEPVEGSFDGYGFGMGGATVPVVG